MSACQKRALRVGTKLCKVIGLDSELGLPSTKLLNMFHTCSTMFHPFSPLLGAVKFC